MQVVIMDGQGGGVGRSVAERLVARGLSSRILVVGTNAVATSNMMRAGVPAGATGENAVVYNCSRAELIIGPMGILLPNAMYGEITAVMAEAVAASPAKKILIPVQNLAAHTVHIVGVEQKSMSAYVEEAAQAALVYLGEA